MSSQAPPRCHQAVLKVYSYHQSKGTTTSCSFPTYGLKLRAASAALRGAITILVTTEFYGVPSHPSFGSKR